MTITTGAKLLDKADILEAARCAGVVGASDGFPTHIKLAKPFEVVIANACELEPLVFSTKYILVQNAEKMVNGLELAMCATGADRGIIAYVNSIPEVDAAVRSAAAGRPGIEIFHAPPFYPIEDDFTIAYAATGRIVPNSATLDAVGVCVLDAETLCDLSEAANGTPVTERTVTVAGEVSNPSVLRVPLGLEISQAIERVGGVTNDAFSVLIGGPISGRIVDDLSQPISKTTASITVLPANHVQIQRRTRPLSSMLMHARSSCESCTECTLYCTRYLSGQDIEPHQIMRLICYSLDSLNKSITSAFNCHECGVCDIVCRMGLSPRVICREIKAHLRAMGWTTVPESPPRKPPQGFIDNRIPVEELAERLGVQKYTQAIDPRRILNTQNSVPKVLCSVIIPLLQHVGAPATPTVKIGETVSAGQLIGEIPQGQTGARVHTCLKGKVEAISDCIFIHQL